MLLVLLGGDTTCAACDTFPVGRLNPKKRRCSVSLFLVVYRLSGSQLRNKIFFFGLVLNPSSYQGAISSRLG